MQHCRVRETVQIFRVTVLPSKMSDRETTRSFQALDSSFIEEFLCCDCGNKYRTKSGLRKHRVLKHSDNQPYKCCGKSYVERSSLEAHQRAHHDKKKLECGKCNETFTRKSALNRHMISHGNTEKKEFTCTICKQDFLRRDELVDHIKGVHEKAKRFSCTICSKKYVWRASLCRHLSKSHK